MAYFDANTRYGYVTYEVLYDFLCSCPQDTRFLFHPDPNLGNYPDSEEVSSFLDQGMQLDAIPMGLPGDKRGKAFDLAEYIHVNAHPDYPAEIYDGGKVYPLSSKCFAGFVCDHPYVLFFAGELEPRVASINDIILDVYEDAANIRTFLG